MSSQIPRLCALSTSSRVGDERHYMQYLLAPSSKVLKTLIARWSHKLRFLVLSQLPSWMVTRASCTPNLIEPHSVTIILMVRTIPAVVAHRIIPMRQPWKILAFMLPFAICWYLLRLQVVKQRRSVRLCRYRSSFGSWWAKTAKGHETHLCFTERRELTMRWSIIHIHPCITRNKQNF